MALEDALQFIQILLALGVILLVLFQASGAGVGSLFGGTGGGAIQKTRRGLEKTLFQWTIIFSAGFILNAILQLLIQ